MQHNTSNNNAQTMLQKTHTYDDINNDVFWQIYDELQNKCSDKMTV